MPGQSVLAAVMGGGTGRAGTRVRPAGDFHRIGAQLPVSLLINALYRAGHEV